MPVFDFEQKRNTLEKLYESIGIAEPEVKSWKKIQVKRDIKEFLWFVVLYWCTYYYSKILWEVCFFRSIFLLILVVIKNFQHLWWFLNRWKSHVWLCPTPGKVRCESAGAVFLARIFQVPSSSGIRVAWKRRLAAWVGGKRWRKSEFSFEVWRGITGSVNKRCKFAVNNLHRIYTFCLHFWGAPFKKFY